MSQNKFGVRFNYATQLWRAYLSHNSLPQLDRWLANELKQHKSFGKQDRRWYSEVLFSAARFAYLAALADVGSTMGANELTNDSLYAAANWLKDSDKLINYLHSMDDEIFFRYISIRHAAENPDFLWPTLLASTTPNAIMLSIKNQSHLTPFAMAWAGIPLWYTAQLQQRALQSEWNDATTTAFCRGQSTRAPLWLRLNNPNAKEEVVAELHNCGFVVEDHGLALRATGDRGIFEFAAYKKGLFEIQDWASQQVGERLRVKGSEIIWDACAGGGGKTMQISATLANRGAVHASDIREYKLDEIKRRAKRAGLHNIRCAVWDGSTAYALPREVAKHGGFHGVLVDAPCSASGTWRRNPDVKLRFDVKQLQELNRLQEQLLLNASQAVKPGGRLVYATCSWIAEENEAIIDAFIASQPAFALVAKEIVGHPAADSDTFFVAELTRNG